MTKVKFVPALSIVLVSFAEPDKDFNLFMNDIIILKNKLSNLRKIAKTVSPQFDDTQYQLNPVIEKTVLEAFEQRYQIRLPEDYRNFLLQIGNGGNAKMRYGIGYEHDMSFFLENSPDDILKRPFLWSEAWQPKTPEEFEKVMSQNEYPLQGAIIIGTYGCSIMAHLVISGDERGNIWVEDFGSDQGIWPEGNFFDWYNTWLDGVLACWVDPKITEHFQVIKAAIQVRIPLLESLGEQINIVDIYIESPCGLQVGLVIKFQFIDFQKIQEIENASQDKLLKKILSFIEGISDDNSQVEENGYKKSTLILCHFEGIVPYSCIRTWSGTGSV